ncbi:MAG TPA: class I SAM-dependent methyltransferase, partial [Thermodesulfobacteriota bacterium]|nr:class I SAM-dependent methyltransferase [Thermodesulfobacteriota bacterium]
ALRVLVLGDGPGNDSLVLAHAGFVLDYFDVPGSRTSAFARRRFEASGLLGRAIRPVADYGGLLDGRYDAVVTFELLEHLPDPVAAIRDIAAMLRPGGIALVTEGFGAVADPWPTHLLANRRFEGRTPFLFLAHGLRLAWYGRRPTFRPFEFEKVGRPTARDRLRLLLDGHVLGRWLSGRLHALRPAPYGRTGPTESAASVPAADA